MKYHIALIIFVSFLIGGVSQSQSQYFFPETFEVAGPTTFTSRGEFWSIKPNQSEMSYDSQRADNFTVVSATGETGYAQPAWGEGTYPNYFLGPLGPWVPLWVIQKPSLDSDLPDVFGVCWLYYGRTHLECRSVVLNPDISSVGY